MRRGEPLTDVRLLHSLPLPPGTVATPVRLADPDTAQLVAPGSTIDVLAAWEGQPTAQLVADNVTVVTIPKADNDHGALIVLATTPSQATQLAAAQAGGRLSITINHHPQ
ncbi:hypothetical protein [Nonomuraea guangzhouensis]|uniref:Flp pilus assembly protein CpaB n=1 Tax=Nonomuraea guangzhouensis TaxID=1291555 RepID=A0ABW4GYN6_9ACTN|nr:hypothetical protein [Nonomuraea guangzhouensis]